MEPIEVECPNCGAALPGRDPTAGWTCRYCGTSFRVDRVRSAKTVAGVRLSPEQLAELARAIRAGAGARPGPGPEAEAAPPPPLDKTTRAATTLAVVIGVGAALAGGAVAVYSLRSGPAPVTLGNTVFGPKFVWDDTRGPPLIHRAGGRALAINTTRDIPGDDGLYVDAFDLADGERVYHLGPFGTYAQNSQAVHLGLVGSALAVTTPTPSLEIFDPALGTKRSSTPLTDRVERFCPLEDGRVYFEQADERAFVIQRDSGDLVPADEVPAPCRRSRFPKARGRSDHKIRGAFVERRKFPDEPRIPGAKTLERFEDGDRVVLVGVRDPGTPMPKAAAFDAKGAPLWQVEVADVPQASYRADADLFAAVDEGRLYVLFGTGADGWRMTAIGTADGARLWSADLAPLFAVDSISFLLPVGESLLVGRLGGTEVWDARAGTRSYVLGSLTYE